LEELQTIYPAATNGIWTCGVTCFSANNLGLSEECLSRPGLKRAAVCSWSLNETQRESGKQEWDIWKED